MDALKASIPRGLVEAASNAASSAAIQGAIDRGAAAASSLSAKLGDPVVQQFKQKITAVYGEEFFDMLTALTEVMGKVGKEINITGMNYGMPLALPLVHYQHDTLPATRTTGELAQQNRELAGQAKHWASFALGAYGAKQEGGPEERVAKRLEEFRAQVKIAYLDAEGVQCPGHYVAVDSARRAVVLGVRGTVSLSDAITDAVGNSVPFPEYPGVETHQAILVSAREVLKRTRGALNEALAENRGFGVVVCGHSLGAGTSILCALLLAAEPLDGRPPLRCFAYAPPPLLSKPAHPAVQKVEINAFVNRNDMVPRISLHNVYILGMECVAVDKADVAILDRIKLIHQGKAPAEEDENRNKLMGAVVEAREKAKTEKHSEFVQHYIPGRVFFIDSDSSPARVLSSSCEEFQGLVLRGGKALMEDHRMPNYVEGLKALPEAGVTFPPPKQGCCAVQ